MFKGAIIGVSSRLASIYDIELKLRICNAFIKGKGDNIEIYIFFSRVRGMYGNFCY